MTSCEHLAWINLSGTHQYTLHDTKRMNHILPDLIDPINQWPSLLLFVGNKTKNIALREIFPHNNIIKSRQNEITNLRVDTTTVNSNYPIFVADSDPTYKISSRLIDYRCHEALSYSCQWDITSSITSFDLIHARLFFPFSDVICIFAAAFLSLDDVVNHLKRWAAIGSSTDAPRPKAIIVVKGNEASTTLNVLEAQDLGFNLNQQEIIKFYSSVVVLYLDEQLSSLARHRRLKEVLFRHADEMRHFRQNARCLYSAIHFNRFFQEAIKHIAHSPEVPFNFVAISRQHNIVSFDYCEHLIKFFRLTSDLKIDIQRIISFVASSILLDAYPPGMHGKT